MDTPRIVLVDEVYGDGENCLRQAARAAKLDPDQLDLRYFIDQRLPWNKFHGVMYETIQEPTYTSTGKLSKVTKKVTRRTQRYNDRAAEIITDLERLREAGRLNLVVGLGNEALQTFTAFDGIQDYRGSVLPGHHGLECKVLPTVRPGYVLRGNTGEFWILAHDLAKAKRENEYPEIRRYVYASCSDPRHSIDSVVRDLEYVATHPGHAWTLDVETRAGTLACFAIAYWVGESLYGFCVPVQTTTGPYWEPADELRMWKALNYAASTNPNLCNQNIEYDTYYLLHYGVEPAGIYMDTMLAHSILHPEFPKSLDFLASYYLDDVVFWKSDHRDWTNRTQDEALWEYNVKDAVYTLRIVGRIDNDLKRRKMWEMYHGQNRHDALGRSDSPVSCLAGPEERPGW